MGHGVGAIIHEWSNLKPQSSDILPTNCVIMVEPGFCLKGFGGVRIEDMVLITKKGCLNLMEAPKNVNDIILK